MEFTIFHFIFLLLKKSQISQKIYIYKNILFSVCKKPRVDLVFVVDRSESVGSDNWEKFKEFIKDVLMQADINDGSVRVGLIVFSTAVQIEFNLNTYSTKTDVYNAIDAIPYIDKGWTNTAAALELMRTKAFTVANGDRLDVDNVAIVLTDGLSNIDKKKTIPSANAARNEGIHIFGVGIASGDPQELYGISNKPSEENAFSVNDFTELQGVTEDVFTAVCGE